jgi:hypothetical protein
MITDVISILSQRCLFQRTLDGCLQVVARLEMDQTDGIFLDEFRIVVDVVDLHDNCSTRMSQRVALLFQ